MNMFILMVLCVSPVLSTAFISQPLQINFGRIKTPSSSSSFLLQMTPTGSNSTVAIREDENRGEVQLRKSPFKSKMPTHDKGGPVQPINSITEFLHAIESAPQNGIVVVQFHAKWCKVCARVIVKLRQMAQRMKKKTTPVPVSFISVEITANQEICSTLGLKKFPFIHMYRNSECVAAFGTGPAHNFQKVVGETMDEKLAYTEDKWENFRAEFKNEIATGLQKFESLRLSTFFDGEDGIDESRTNGDIAP
jgi:thiol-disulfide isomerase/thioredoxin